MFLTFEDRPSGSPYVERVWHCCSTTGGPFHSMAEGNLELVVTQLGSFAQVTLRGPVTQAQGEGTARLLGAILLGCTFLYAAPQTAALGAIMLTGYLGGAVAVKLRIGDPLLTHVLFGVYVGTLVWAGLYLRDARLRQILPLRSDVHDQTALPA